MSAKLVADESEALVVAALKSKYMYTACVTPTLQ